MSKSPAVAKKRGRKAIGDHAMSAKERQAARRERLRGADGRIFTIGVKGEYLKFVDALAESQKETPAAVMQQIVENALLQFLVLSRNAEKMSAQGASEQQIQDYFAEQIAREAGVRAADEGLHHD